MPTRSPTPEQALAAMQRIEPFLGRFSSSWCRQVLYSTLHHTSGAFDQAALTHKSLSAWIGHEPWPNRGFSYLYHLSNLHWCEVCLQNGYHSFAHQLIGLTHCPLHDAPIRHGCPHCEFSILIRSRLSAASSEPFRNCLHCHEPLLKLTTSPKWMKSAKFLDAERAALLRLFHWAKRVDGIHCRVYHHSEGATVRGQTRWPSGDQYRYAVEAVHPFPDQIKVERKPPGLMVTVVTIDRRSVRERPPLSPVELADLGEAMITHLGQKPVPEKWLRHWRTGQVEAPAPATAGESSHFAMWRDQVLFESRHFLPSGPRESLRRCMLPLVAARLVGHFEEQARCTAYYDPPDPAFSFCFFDDLHSYLANLPLGESPAIVVELHNTCSASTFPEPARPPGKAAQSPCVPKVKAAKAPTTGRSAKAGSKSRARR